MQPPGPGGVAKLGPEAPGPMLGPGQGQGLGQGLVLGLGPQGNPVLEPPIHHQQVGTSQNWFDPCVTLKILP